MLLYDRVKDRGWNRETLEPIFIDAHNKIASPVKRNKNSASNENTAILHFEYHRHDVTRKRVRKIWNETCTLLEKNVQAGGLGIERIICYYSTPKNPKDLLQKAKLLSSEAMRPLLIFKRGVESMSILTPFFIWKRQLHNLFPGAALPNQFEPHCCMIAGNSYHIMTSVSREKRQDTGWSFEFLKIPTVTRDGVKRLVSAHFIFTS